MTDIYKLQNGSDIRGTVGDDELLNEKSAYLIGCGFMQYLKIKKHLNSPVITIGRDTRLTGEMIEKSLVDALYDCGAEKVYVFGVCSTPAMYVSTKKEFLNADAAIEITASHLPKDKNGLKFFTKQGGLNDNDIKFILKTTEKCYFPETPNVKKAEKVNFTDDYSAWLVDFIRKQTADDLPLNGMKIIVDAGGGAAGFFAEKVLQPLGADTSGSVFLEYDGEFKNHVPNPENSEVMKGFCETVKKENADLGIIFDTDGDRAALSGKNGEAIGKSRLIAIMSEIVLRDYPGGIIVTDSVTSASLGDFIVNRGGIHRRFKRGYNNVISEARRLHEEGKSAPLAIETSGHAALYENDYLDDGAYVAAKALIRLAQLKKENKDFSSVLSDYIDPAEAVEIRLEIYREDFTVCGNDIISEFEMFARDCEGWEAETPNYEGVRVKCDKNHGDGWVLMRMSLHEPVLPINIESDSIGGVKIIKDKLSEFLKNYKNDLQEI